MGKILILLTCTILLGLYGCRTNDKLILTNENFLIISDSISIPIDSLTIPNSNSLSYIDSLLIIPNEGLNTLSIINIAKPEHYYYDFSLSNRDIKMDAAWFQNKDSFFIYQKKKKCIYLLNNKLIVLDSFSLKRLLPPTEKIVGPAINLSTSQLPYFFNKKIYYSGISIGENLGEKNRYVIGEVAQDTVKYYVKFPNDYATKNLGGIYYRLTYHTVVDDSLIHISFPASDQIAIFNIYSKEVMYKAIYPKISNLIKAFDNNNNKIVLSMDQSKIASHFYGKYSFKEIIYDPFRKIFYRLLLLPGNELDIQKNIFGKQHSYILVYDKNYNYLGCKLIGLNVNHANFFITKKGLYLLKNSNNENILQFYLFSIGSNYQQQLQN